MTTGSVYLVSTQSLFCFICSHQRFSEHCPDWD